MRRLLESLGAFVLMLVAWVIFSWAVATLASSLPWIETAEFIGGVISMVGLFAALGIAARIAKRRL